jgi:hypothetical protein
MLLMILLIELAFAKHGISFFLLEYLTWYIIGWLFCTLWGATTKICLRLSQNIPRSVWIRKLNYKCIACFLDVSLFFLRTGDAPMLLCDSSYLGYLHGLYND